jgi:hypothetical protein
MKQFLITVLFLALVGSQAIALGISAVVAPILSQVLKRMTGVSGFAAVAVAAVVAAVIAIVATYIAGEAHTVGEFIKNASAVFGVATLVYRAVTAATATPSGN